MGSQERLGNTEHLFLRAVRVDDHPALHPRRGSRDVGQAVADEPAGARFGHGDGQTPRSQQPADHGLETLVVLAIAVETKGRPHLAFHRPQRGLGQRPRGAARDEPDMDIALDGYAGDGYLAVLAQPRAKTLLGLGRAEPRGKEHALHDHAIGRERRERLEKIPEQELQMRRAQRQDHEAPTLPGERPAVPAVGRRGQELGAFGQERQPVEPTGHRLSALGEGGLEQSQPALVEDEPGSGESRDQPGHELAGGAAGLSEDDDQPAGLEGTPEGGLDRRLDLLDHLPRGDGNAFGGEDARHRPGRRIVRGAVADREQPCRAHRGTPKSCRAPIRRTSV
jgi:hypothetical protein